MTAVHRHRVHFVGHVGGYADPQSFRTDVYAKDPAEATIKAVAWLHLQPVEIIDHRVMSVEKVPVRTGADFSAELGSEKE